MQPTSHTADTASRVLEEKKQPLQKAAVAQFQDVEFLRPNFAVFVETL